MLFAQKSRWPSCYRNLKEKVRLKKPKIRHPEHRNFNPQPVGLDLLHSCDKSFWFTGDFSQWLHKKWPPLFRLSLTRSGLLIFRSGELLPCMCNTYLPAVGNTTTVFSSAKPLWDSGALSISIPLPMSGWTFVDDGVGSLPMMAAIFAKAGSWALRLKPNHPAYALKKKQKTMWQRVWRKHVVVNY